MRATSPSERTHQRSRADAVARTEELGNLSFSQGVDPEGTLLKLRKHDLIHGRDNKVEYMKMTKIEGRVQ